MKKTTMFEAMQIDRFKVFGDIGVTAEAMHEGVEYSAGNGSVSIESTTNKEFRGTAMDTHIIFSEGITFHLVPKGVKYSKEILTVLNESKFLHSTLLVFLWKFGEAYTLETGKVSNVSYFLGESNQIDVNIFNELKRETLELLRLAGV